MSLSSNRTRVVSDLASLLRENGERILTGFSKLSLTTACLSTLNDGFNDICDTDFELSFEVLPLNRARQPLYHDLHFLYDFMQKTPALKIIHGSNTIQGRVNVSAFRALQTLQIKKTPIHMIEGLQKLRGRLSTLVCSRCVQTLHELLETCGGDISTPMSWPELRALSLCYNNIEQLDNSLRLLQVLEMLDLSHNCIELTDNNLEYLTELRMVNLGYNSLQQVPIFAISARAKLRTLILKNNDLENLYGLEELSGLRDLDVSCNCISDHRTLAPLRHLHKLNKLKVAGNPICFHVQHRILTIEKVSPLAVKKLVLDERDVTQAEGMHCEKTVPSAPPSWSPRLSRHGLSSAEPSDFEISFESTGREDSDTLRVHGMSVSKKKSRKGLRMSRKVRRVNISDMDLTDGETLSQDGSQPSISTTPTSRDHLEVKETWETIRTQLGPDWLPSLTAKHEAAYQQAATEQAPPRETEDDIYLNESFSLSGEVTSTDTKEDAPVSRDTEAEFEGHKDGKKEKSTDCDSA